MMDDLSRRQALKLAATAGAVAAGVTLTAESGLAQEKGKKPAKVKVGKDGKDLGALKLSDFEPYKMPEGEFPPLQVVQGAVIARPLVKPIKMEADGDWLRFACSARGWNLIDVPDDWTDVLFYVETISWNNGLGQVTGLGEPGDGTALLVSVRSGVHVYVTSISAEQPQRMFGLSGAMWSATADSYDRDNSGGYTIVAKKRV